MPADVRLKRVGLAFPIDGRAKLINPRIGSSFVLLDHEQRDYLLLVWFVAADHGNVRGHLARRRVVTVTYG